MTVNGYLPGTLIIQGAITGEIYSDWLEWTVLPQLAPGSIVVMDNASIHHTKGMRELIESFDCYLEYLPPYSPDFNPIELSFNELKAWIRAHVEEANTYEKFNLFLQKAVNELPKSSAVQQY